LLNISIFRIIYIAEPAAPQKNCKITHSRFALYENMAVWAVKTGTAKSI